MSQSANDWASPDPGKNIALASADAFGNRLAGALCLQIGSRWVQTQLNQIISEQELRQNQFMAPLPVNLYATLAVPGSLSFNLAEFRTALLSVSGAGDPTGSLVMLLQQMLPQSTSIASMFTRIPAVQAVIASAIKSI